MTAVTARARRLDAELDRLAQAQRLLARARGARAEAPRDAFALSHLAALRGAGILVRRAAATRRRRLPLNVWQALHRVGGEDAAWAQQMEPLVREGERLERSERHHPDPRLLAQHLELTAAALARIEQELLGAEGASLPLAG
ncbi:hypothetical protein JSY14_10275 [Brachybacterium sp. EF45031]|uniref:SAV_6107 family HEPN domain-containing protein n=1 Tax=Brachybacterium sillae TaxID=2810536 RepID=UPI00217E5304|nr:SAV_6107 family HEPN domain-containing protein [Brachybacterium sillae]MCS6712391.1 hypothetical protein [Brachybacterium sillae]